MDIRTLYGIGDTVEVYDGDIGIVKRMHISGTKEKLIVAYFVNCGEWDRVLKESDIKCSITGPKKIKN